MNGFERIKLLFMGLLTTIIGVVLMMIRSDVSLNFVVLFFCIAFIISGIRYLVFFFQMSRHMIGGINQLIAGVLLIDMGLVASMVSGKPNIYVALYLIAINLFTGIVSTYRATLARKRGDRNWGFRFVRGMLCILLAIGCIIFIKSDEYLISLYSFSLIVSGVMGMVEAFRPTDVVYIQ